jgi:malonyl-CoA O-methyltransferase
MKEQVKASFSKSAATYDQHAVMHEQIINELLASINGNYQKILDIGCGTGTLVAKLVDKFPQAEIIGIDLAPGMIEQAKAKVNTPEVAFLIGDGEALDFKAGSFDLVVSTSSLHWMDCQQVFKEIRRVLKPGGAFFFTTFGPATLAEIKQTGLTVNTFSSKEDLLAVLNQYFLIKTFKAKIIKLEFTNIFKLGYYLRQIGARLTEKRVVHTGLTKLIASPIQATFEIYYCSAFL